MLKIELPAHLSSLKIKQHAQARSLKLHIDPLHKIPVLTVPPRCSKKRIEEFLKTSTMWIENQLQKTSTVNLASIKSLTIAGKPYTVEFIETEKACFVHVDSVKHHLIVESCASIQKIILTRFLKEKALEQAQSLVNFYADALQVKIKKIGVKEYKSRWGCCFKRGEIYLSWRLILAPPEVFQYVCAHEVAHMIHMDHSLKFWKTVHLLYPNYKENVRWLQKNGKTLFNIF